MASLAAQRERFKKRLAAQPVIQRPIPIQKPAVSSGSAPQSAESSSSDAGHLKRAAGATQHLVRDDSRMRLYNVISCIKRHDGPLTMAELKKATGVDVAKDQALFTSLTRNAKVIFDVEKDTFSYKPDYNVKTKEEVLLLLRERQISGGIEICELKDSNANVVKLAEELAASGEILIVRNRDGTARILYYNDVTLNTVMDEEFCTLWRSLKVPDEADLPKRMAEAGLKSMEVFETGVKREPATKRPKQRTRKGKITNTHLEGIDLTRDYVPQK